MKKLFYSVFLLFFTVAITTSCQKEIQPIIQQSLESKLSADEDFAKMLNSAGVLLKNFDLENITEESFVAKLKANQDGITTELNIFLESIQKLEVKYEFSKLSSTELEATIKGAFDLNPELQLNFATIHGKANSDGAKICKGVVSLASLLGGGALCTAVGVTTIPIVGGVLCTGLTTVITGILHALCDLIP